MDDGGDAGAWVGCFADVLALEDEGARSQAVATIGRPEELAARAVAENLSVWSDLQARLAEALDGAKSVKSAESRINAWASSISGSEDLASGIFTTTLQSDLAGQLFVRTIELPELDPMRALDERPVPPFLRLTFEEALQLFLDRRILTPEEFERLSAEHRAQAFTATRLASDALRTRAFELLSQAIARGDTLREFAHAIRDDEASLGVTQSSTAYLETVFRTNVVSAYGTGRYRQITSDVVASARPYVQFRATGDNRTTSICRSLHRRVFAQDDPSWRTFAPPLHFNCRSVIVALREPPSGVEVTDASTLDVRPQPGFGV